MTDSVTEITIDVLGKTFQIKCAESQVASLQQASDYLGEKIRYFRQQGIAEFDRILVIAALNIVHELLAHDAEEQNRLQAVHQRLRQMQDKMDQALSTHDPKPVEQY